MIKITKFERKYFKSYITSDFIVSERVWLDNEHYIIPEEVKKLVT